MVIKPLLLAVCASLAWAMSAHAADFAPETADAVRHEHGGQIFHMFRLEMDTGSSADGASVQSWDLDGWIGTDENKLWLKSEGARADDRFESAEFWALYSRSISTFWDAQAGIRYDAEPEPTAYFTVGVNGLAPYWFETEAHLFVSEHGGVTARLRQENDLLLTQKLIAQPYAEFNFATQDVPEQAIGAGVVDGKIGLQIRYAFTRKFAPYLDISYGRKFGETASIAKANGEKNDAWIGAAGLRFMF